MHAAYPFRAVSAVCLAVALLAFHSFVDAAPATLQRIEWQKVPIEVPLIVGEEQRIEFPAAVRVGVPGSIQPLIRTQSVNGAVYLLANAPFDASRLMVREIDSGRIYLFDVTAAAEGTVGDPIRMFVAEQTENADGLMRNSNEPTPRRHGYIELTRFAARQLYAPSRLASSIPGVVRVPIEHDPFDLVHGGAVEAVPLVGWRANGLHVTAVKLSNRTSRAQTLDPRDLRGEWVTATFQHHRLLPKGDEADTTAVYLISKRPFDVAR